MDRRTFLTASGAVATVSAAGCIDSGSTAGDRPDQHVESPRLELFDTHGPVDHWDYEWYDDRLEITIGHEDPAPDAVDGNAISSTVSFAAGPYNLSPVSTVYYQFRHTSEPGIGVEAATATQDYSFFAILHDLDKLGLKPIRSVHRSTETDDDIDRSSILQNQTDSGNETYEFDVASIDGPRFIGVGANVGTQIPEIMQLTISDIYGVNSAGERVFELDHSEERLTTL